MQSLAVRTSFHNLKRCTFEKALDFLKIVETRIPRIRQICVFGEIGKIKSLSILRRLRLPTIEACIGFSENGNMSPSCWRLRPPGSFKRSSARSVAQVHPSVVILQCPLCPRSTVVTQVPESRFQPVGCKVTP